MLSTKDKLNKIKNDSSQWSQKLDEIKTGMDNFENAKRQNRDAEQYLNTILPTYWKIFHTHNIYEKRNDSLPSDLTYDVGIFLVGFSTLPIVLSLAEIHPNKKIYFLYSKETKPMLQEISDRINSMLPGDPLSNRVACSVKDSNYALEIQSSSDPVQTFKQIKEIIDKVGEKRIALDLTGGKKTMLGGGFTGGAILGFTDSIRSFACDMFYVDSLEYNQKARAPTPGTEFLNLLKNPYEVYNVQSVQQANKLFEKHNYEAAAVLWGDVRSTLEKHKSKYGLETEFRQAVNQYRMAKCYSLWDSFDYKQAKKDKGHNAHHDKNWGYFEKHVHNSIDVLDILSKVEDKKSLFEEEKVIIHYAVDRYQNAIRRKESGRLDDAIVRFTQVVEILCLYQIDQIAKKECLIDETNKKVTDAPYKWRITPLIRFLFGKIKQYKKNRNGFYQISCSSELLKIKEYGYSRTNEIINLIEERNDFVHVESNPGSKKMQKTTDKLKDLALKFLKNFSHSYCCVNGLDFEILLELHRFRRLTE